MNPARTLGPGIVGADLTGWRACVVGDIIGAAIAVVIIILVRGLPVKEEPKPPKAMPCPAPGDRLAPRPGNPGRRSFVMGRRQREAAWLARRMAPGWSGCSPTGAPSSCGWPSRSPETAESGEELLQAALERVLRKPGAVQADTEGYLRRVLYNLAGRVAAPRPVAAAAAAAPPAAGRGAGRRHRRGRPARRAGAPDATAPAEAARGDRAPGHRNSAPRRRWPRCSAARRARSSPPRPWAVAAPRAGLGRPRRGHRADGGVVMSAYWSNCSGEGIDRLTAGADVPAGIVGRARRRHRQRRIAIRITAAAGTALVIAVAAVVAVSGAGRAPRSGGGPVSRLSRTATSRAQQALAAQAAKGQAIEDSGSAVTASTSGFTVLNMALSPWQQILLQRSRARGAGQRDRAAVDRLDLPRAEPARRDLGHRRARLPQHDPHGHQAVWLAGNQGLRGRLPGQDPVAHHRARPVRPRALRSARWAWSPRPARAGGRTCPNCCPAACSAWTGASRWTASRRSSSCPCPRRSLPARETVWVNAATYLPVRVSAGWRAGATAHAA